MLKDFDAACKKHNIPYMLFAGTALGAVRHHGFIPWDDDIDVIMLRSDYERFFDEAASELDKGKYYVQREFSEHWPMQFSKLRLNGTTCIEKYHPKDMAMHQGVYIDIFPCDSLSDNRIVRRLQFAASKVVIAKSLYARGYETNSITKKIFIRLCRLLPKKPFWKLCVLRTESNSRMVHSFLGASSRYRKSIYQREWLTQTVQLEFEGSLFPVSAHYDELLTCLYGDYMTPSPPEEQSIKKHVAILDLEHPYTEYIEQQRQMKIDTYSRSIR